MENKNRCNWCTNDEIYQKYHDEEWGIPVYDDRLLFEMLILEGAQAGLSWLTVLKKRDNYRLAFDNFDIEKISCYNDEKFDELINNSGIVRNKLKIKSTVQNAKVFISIQKEFGSFSNYIWGFVDGKIVKNSFSDISDIPAKTELSDIVSKDLKKRGMNFVGSTIIYAYLQAIGIVNDHTKNCFLYKK